MTKLFTSPWLFNLGFFLTRIAKLAADWIETIGHLLAHNLLLKMHLEIEVVVLAFIAFALELFCYVAV